MAPRKTMTQANENAPEIAVPDADRQGNELLLGGLGVMAVGALGAIAGGALCPVCIVATPALLGVGAYRKWQARRGPTTEENKR